MIHYSVPFNYTVESNNYRIANNILNISKNVKYIIFDNEIIKRPLNKYDISKVDRIVLFISEKNKSTIFVELEKVNNVWYILK